MGAARSGPHAPGRRTGARAEVSGGRRAARLILLPQTMTLSRILIPFLASVSLGAQTFIQMSDPQFGMFSKDADYVHETANFEFAVAAANRIKPAFVIVTADLTNKPGDA